MTDGFVVTPERLREISVQMSTGASDVDVILTALADDVAPVRSEWVGVAQAQFNTLWDQLRTDANSLHSVLTGIAKLTQSAAMAYEEAERSIVRSFDEFRVEQVTLDTEQVAFEAAMADAPEVTTTVEDVVVAEAEEEVSQVPAAAVERPKAKLPWSRFMAKAVHDSETGEFMIGGRRHERRFKASDSALKPGTRLCRLCFTVVVLEPEYIEMTETHVYVCCPHCERSFPIRHSDAEMLLTCESPTS